MIGLNEKAGNYAEENVINILKEAFAKVYADGYHDGYKDREEEIPVDLRDHKTYLVDLGLPSGTLWSNDFESYRNNEYLYVPFGKTKDLMIPTREQCKELVNTCKWDYKNLGRELILYCIGPNGNVITFKSTGYKTTDKNIIEERAVYFWIKDKKELSQEDFFLESAACLNHYNNSFIHGPQKLFVGYKVPLRLVNN